MPNDLGTQFDYVTLGNLKIDEGDGHFHEFLMCVFWSLYEKVISDPLPRRHSRC